jgi:dTDP-4-dehydrorhamnose reductase
MKFLVTGSTGLVGSQVVKDLTEQNHTVYSCYHDSTPDAGIPIMLDLLDSNNIKKVVSDTNPDIIIHLAAMTNVDQCETQPDVARKINSVATEILAKQAAKQKAFFVYVSTDYVFDGKIGMKKEKDKPNPLGVYGRSKLEGETHMQNLASSWAIARTSTPFGIHKSKKSFPVWVKESLESKKEIPVLVDQYTSPTYVPNLSKMLIEIATRQIVGIIHLAGATRISRYELAKMLADKLDLDESLLKPITIGEMKWIAQRPRDSSLDVFLASNILNKKPQTIEKSIETLLSDFDFIK